MPWYIVEVEEVVKHHFRIEAQTPGEAEYLISEVIDPQDALDSELYSWTVDSIVREDEI